MFSVEIRVKGTLTHHIYGQNVGEVDDNANLYNYVLYCVEGHGVTSGTVQHVRKSGLTKLVKLIIDDVTLKEGD